MANPLNSIEVIPKVTVGATPTAFPHLQSATLNVEQRDIEFGSPGTSGWIQRDTEFSAWTAEIVTFVPSSSDSAINQMETHITTPSQATLNFTEPSLKDWNGTANIGLGLGIQVGNKYAKTFPCAGSGALATS